MNRSIYPGIYQDPGPMLTSEQRPVTGPIKMMVTIHYPLCQEVTPRSGDIALIILAVLISLLLPTSTGQ